jgi:hypothetical protein
MSDDPDNIVLQHLRAIRGDIGEIKTQVKELRHRLGLLEIGYATVQSRLDHIGGDIAQIKRRLDLVDA